MSTTDPYPTPNEDLKRAALDAVVDNVSASTTTDDKCRALLLAWLVWWRSDDSAPPKLPDALHVRTAVYLITTASTEDRDVIVAALS